MSRRLLDHDPDSGVTTYHHYDDSTDTTAIETVQDVAPHLERAKAIRNANDGGAKGLSDFSRQGIKRGMWYVGSVPIGVQYVWLKDHGVRMWDRNHWGKVLKLLESPDYAYLRTGVGKIT